MFEIPGLLLTDVGSVDETPKINQTNDRHDTEVDLKWPNTFSMREKPVRVSRCAHLPGQARTSRLVDIHQSVSIFVSGDVAVFSSLFDIDVMLD